MAHSHLDSCITEVWELLDRTGHETADSPGVTRAAWSGNEERAADLVGGFGDLLMMGQGGHITHDDTVGNLTMFGKQVLPRLAELG